MRGRKFLEDGMMQLKSAIKSEAHSLGFELVGVTTPDPPTHFDVYEQWLEAGHHGKMSWMGTERNRQRRADPKAILPECKSILVLGIHYHPSTLQPSPMGEGSVNEGKIASYAWGDDYHDVLPERLKALVAFIEAQMGYSIPNRWYTDTGPILERELAQRAGLGWIGKNTCLINPQSGSYFLLAEILLGIELQTDEPITSDHCGTCTRCIEACPTDCILPDRTIDASQCISYLTIEEKGAIPDDLRSQMGHWIFGCDICQQVCPWNQKFSVSSNEERFIPGPGRAHPILQDELNLTPLAFSQKFKGSPIKRTKRRGYLRNVAVALGNLGEPDTIPFLTQALNDTEPLIRSHAAWALGQIGGILAQQALDKASVTERDEAVQAEIKAARANLKS